MNSFAATQQLNCTHLPLLHLSTHVCCSADAKKRAQYRSRANLLQAAAAKQAAQQQQKVDSAAGTSAAVTSGAESSATSAAAAGNGEAEEEKEDDVRRLLYVCGMRHALLHVIADQSDCPCIYHLLSAEPDRA